MFRYLKKDISPDHPTKDTTLQGIPVDVPRLSIGDFRNKIAKVHCGDVWNFKSLAYKLTHGKLLKQPGWSEWRASEWTQIDQYYDQGMFGKPVRVDSNEAVFNLVWTYVIKELDKRKQACCTCDGSPRSGQVRVLNQTYDNCICRKHVF